MPAAQTLILRDRLEHETISIDKYRRTGGYEGLRELLNHEAPENIKKTVLDSGLQGRGGAGFPAGKKWQLLPDDAPHPRYIVANTDEMEPGTFKDRLLLSVNPHTVIEGMIIAGYANSAQKGYFFIRPSYHLVATKIEKALDEARTAGFLGQRILGSDFSFEIVVHRSAGRYICGEAKGLIHALQGERPHPTIEGHLTEEGLWGRPTIVNNAETLAYVPHIVRNGAKWFRDLGKHENAPGNKIYSVCGRVRRPGVFELPFGTPLGEIIEEHAGGMLPGYEFKACLPGGASTRYLTKDFFHVAMDFDSMAKIGPGHRLGTGAVMVFDHTCCLVGITLNLIQFFARESCGWCTPCREGLPYMESLLAALERGEGEADFPARLKEMCRHMRNAYCAFALGAASPVQGLMEDFEGEVNAHITLKKCPLEHDDPNPWPSAPMRGIEDLETGSERYPSCPV